MVQPDTDTRERPYLFHQTGIGDRCRSHHDASNTRVGQGPRVIDRPHSSAGLHMGATGQCGSYAPDDRTIHGIATSRRIQIDDVDPTSTRICETLRHVQRIVSVDGLVSVVTLHQTHHPAAAKIDRWIQIRSCHACATVERPVAIETKFARRASPTGPDFSGWN
jgi:hypothetical protein